MKYDHFSMLPEQAFQPRNGRFGMTLESGGGGPSTSVTQTSNIPDWMRPQVEALLGGATKEYFDTKMVPGKKAVYDAEGNLISEGTKPTYEITGIKPFKAYSENAADYVAGFTPQQQQVFQEAAGMTTPGQFAPASQFASQAGLGGLSTAGQALGFGAQGADIGQLGLGYGGYGAGIGQQAMEYGRQAGQMGGLYEQMATSPETMQAYMSPYVRNVIEQQKESAVRDAQKAQLAQNLGAARQGTYGGARQLLAATERERALGSQMGQIEAQGLQNAFDRAQQAQQFGVTAGLQGLQGAQQGLGTALQGGQLGLQGIQQALAGQQLGLQGVAGAQAGYGMLGQAGTSLANIGTAQQAADLARMQFQGEMGSQQQAREQQIINQAIQNYGMAREYPYEQLARYSGLLRGYYTPTNVQSVYQAQPSGISQIAGLGTTGYALSQLGKKAGGMINEGDVEAEEGGIDQLAIQKIMSR